jgi:hypothetical protein
LIDEQDDLPSSSAFSHRFGSLISAYRLIGYDSEVDYSFVEANRTLRRLHPEVLQAVLDGLSARGAVGVWDEVEELLHLNGELRVSIVLCRHFSTKGGSSRWLIRLDESLKPDITVAVRMDSLNQGIRDYYLLPAIDLTWKNLRVAEENGLYLDAYRFDNLEYFTRMAERAVIEEAA